MPSLKVYNSLTRKKEIFTPVTPGHVGMYVCGPTVSGESHLGHARPFITFDIVYRYLMHLGYKVRYVRNITDAGHFEEEGREAEDKIAKKAILEKLEPMELVQKYTNLFHWAMRQFNNMVVLRRMRLQSVPSGLPGSMYSVILIGALLNIMVSWLFVVENVGLHSFLNVLMAALLGLLVYLIAAMDNPFRGDFSVSPDAFVEVRDQLMKPAAGGVPVPGQQ